VQVLEALEENSEAYKPGCRAIADIAKARISKVIAKLQAKRATDRQNADLFADTMPDQLSLSFPRAAREREASTLNRNKR